MSSLLIALRPPGVSLAEWRFAVVNDAGSLVQGASGDAATLPAQARVVAIVPARMLSWHRVDLPRANAARMRAALEGVLEDRLLDEPSVLHFALSAQAKPGDLAWVAACDKAWLQAELGALVAAGKTIARVVPELCPAEHGTDTQLWVSGDEHRPLASWVDDTGVQHWPLATFPSSGLDTGKAAVYAEPALAAQAEQTLHHKVTIASAPQRWLRAAAGNWNLAQFELRTFGQNSPGQRFQAGARALVFAPQWRALRWALVLLLMVNLLGLNLWAWNQTRALEAKREALRTALLQYFPQIKLVVNAPQQMQREVAVLRQATGGATARDADVMLTALANAIPDLAVQTAVEFSAGELKLKGIALGSEAVQQAVQRLSASGYQLRTEGAGLVMRAQESP